eukprot:1159111-Pelagomonas_calceolata.AAC.9
MSETTEPAPKSGGFIPRTRSSDTLSAVIGHSVPAIVERSPYMSQELDLDLMHDGESACRSRVKQPQMVGYALCTCPKSWTWIYCMAVGACAILSIIGADLHHAG